MKKLILVVVGVMTLLTSCLTEPLEKENEVNCVANSFEGLWKYHSTNGVKLDSIPDVEIAISDDKSRGDLLIDGRYFYIKPAVGCTAGSLSNSFGVTYELVDENQLKKRTSVFYVFGSTDLYTKD